QTVVKQYFRSFFVWVPFQLFVRLGQVFLGLPSDMRLPGGFPFPAGWTLGSLLLVNLLAAHLTRFRLAWKRSGILILHAGVIVMLLGELVTGLYAVEARMSIQEGETVNFTMRPNEMELALINTSDPATDDVTVVPGGRLRAGATVSDAQLPVNIEVV